MTEEELYGKYPHIIPGSIEDIPKGQIIVGGKGNKLKSHGRICVIYCGNNNDQNNNICLKTRIINIQDARQVKYCTACIRKNRNTRRKIRRGSAAN